MHPKIANPFWFSSSAVLPYPPKYENQNLLIRWTYQQQSHYCFWLCFFFFFFKLPTYYSYLSALSKQRVRAGITRGDGSFYCNCCGRIGALLIQGGTQSLIILIIEISSTCDWKRQKGADSLADWRREMAPTWTAMWEAVTHRDLLQRYCVAHQLLH